jgi:hydrogenase nickel incorporation protein HypA/HybF
MHELSIAMSIVDGALEEAELRGIQVAAVHLRLGALSGVVEEALIFSYEIACQGTPLEGSELIVEDLPVIVFCGRCQREQQLQSVQLFVCPECGTPTDEVRQGRELEVFALEVKDEDVKQSEVQK